MFKVARLSARRPGRRPSFPVTVRPTRADVAVAHSIARNTAPAPEQVARALTWGADEKLLLVLASRRLARLARPWGAAAACRQPRSARNGRRVAAAPWFESRVRPNSAGPPNGDWARAWRPAFRQTKRCFPLRPRTAHGRSGIGGQRVACGSPAGDTRDCGRTVAHPHRDPGALGKRCRCRLRARGRC